MNGNDFEVASNYMQEVAKRIGFFFFFLMIRPPPGFPLFPYPALFRSPDAVRGRAPARGVAVARPTISDADLKRFNDGGIRGIRSSLADPSTRAVTPEMIEPLAK